MALTVSNNARQLRIQNVYAKRICFENTFLRIKGQANALMSDGQAQ
jgi:hypothetical protein